MTISEQAHPTIQLPPYQTAANVGVVMASDPRLRPGALVQVASVDTLRHRAAVSPDLLLVP